MQRCGYLFQAKYYFCIDTKYWNIRGSVLVCWGQKFGFSDVCSLLALITHHLRSPLCSGSQRASMTLTESVMWVAVSWMRVCRFRIWQLSWVIRKKYPLTERLRKGCCFFFFLPFWKAETVFPRYDQSEDSFLLVLPCPEATHSIAGLQSDDLVWLRHPPGCKEIWLPLAVSQTLDLTVSMSLCFFVCNYTKCSVGFK